MTDPYSQPRFIPNIALRSASSAELPLFGPRLARLGVQRPDGSPPLEVYTPALITATSRGVVPHLSRDHVRTTQAIRWVHVPFESFLGHSPPVPTLQPGRQPLHKFLGYVPSQHIVVMSLRDPFDGRDMPSNSKDHVSAYCVRGVRKVTPHAWELYVAACNPDAVVALSDTPFTPHPHSQKRLTKSIERSAIWLLETLKAQKKGAIPVAEDTDIPQGRHSNVFVHMAGGGSAQARTAFSQSMLEPLETRELEQLKPLQRLDDGVAGYISDLVPLHQALSAKERTAPSIPDESHNAMNTITPRAEDSSHTSPELQNLLKASLHNLPPHKPRLVNSARSPHEILRLIRDVGIDLFDGHWAQRAADIGVALDFCFPAPARSAEPRKSGILGPRRRDDGANDLGHNLYNAAYAHDHSRLASCYLDTFSSQKNADSAVSPSAGLRICPCAACSPVAPSAYIPHSSVDKLSYTDEMGPPESNRYLPPFTRSYIHHLLHTHEMSAHSLLVMHNLSVMDAFFAGVRSVLESPSGGDTFGEKVDEFVQMYDESMVVFDEATVDWAEVERARGKGRMAREKIKQAESSLGRAVDL